MHKHEAGQRARRGSLIALIISTMIAAGCGGGGGGDDGSAAANSSTAQNSPSPGATPGANKPPTISATPVAQVNVGAAYTLAPAAQDADGDTLAFSIENRPAWATFNTSTGQLTGTPSAQHVGTSGNVVISVSDGKASASLPAFSITVAQAAAAAGDPAASGAVSLSWDVPTQTVEGGLLDNLAGYRVHYGKSADALTNSIEIQSSGGNQYVVQGLQPGTYYFAVRAVTQTGAQSATSNIISRPVS